MYLSGKPFAWLLMIYPVSCSSMLMRECVDSRDVVVWYSGVRRHGLLQAQYSRNKMHDDACLYFILNWQKDKCQRQIKSSCWGLRKHIYFDILQYCHCDLWPFPRHLSKLADQKQPWEGHLGFQTYTFAFQKLQWQSISPSEFTGPSISLISVFDQSKFSNFLIIQNKQYKTTWTDTIWTNITWTLPTPSQKYQTNVGIHIHIARYLKRNEEKKKIMHLQIFRQFY